jgi:hypothetical protein
LYMKKLSTVPCLRVGNTCPGWFKYFKPMRLLKSNFGVRSTNISKRERTNLERKFE